MAEISMSSNASAWKGKINWSYIQNPSNNTSTITASVGTWKTDGSPSSALSGAYFTGKLYVGDKSVDIEFQQQNVASSNDPQDCATLTATVDHNNDGTGSVYIYCVIEAPSGVSMHNRPLKGGGTYTLTTIPRASTISAANSTEFGAPCSITWTPLSSSFYYKLKFSLGTWSSTTDAIKPGVTSSYEYTEYTIPLDAAEQIPNAVSSKMSVSLYTYNNSSCSTQIGSTSTSSFTATLPDSVIPSIDECVISVDNSHNDVVDGWGLALAGFSGINAEASASGAYGSVITSFNISGSYTAVVAGDCLNYTGGIIPSSGNKKLMITCTDSRGRTSDVFESDLIEFIPYTRPKIRKLSVSKDTYGDDIANNDRMVITGVWEYDDVSGYNSAVAKIYYKTSTANDWTEHPGEYPVSGVEYTLTELIPEDTLSYNFKIVVTDAVGNTAERDAFSSTTKVLMDFQAGGRGLGIGKICEIDNEANNTSSLEVSMDSYFWGNMYLQGAVSMVISSAMFGSDNPEDVISDPKPGQIYFKRVSS